MTEEHNIRYTAAEAVCRILEEDRMSHLVLRKALKEHEGWTEQEKAFFTRLTEGTVERKITLDYVLGLYSRTPVKKMKPWIRTLLRLSVYQLLYMDSVPDSAACNEGVRLAEAKGFGGLKGFVNAVLRQVSRQKARVPFPKETEDLTAFLSVKYSAPVWLVKHFLDLYGRETAETILGDFLKERPLCLRVNTSRISLQEAKERLKEEEVPFQPSAFLPDMLLFSEGLRPESLSLFREGFLQAQDESSALAVKAAGIRPGMTVMDVCAAPGGKSILAADLTGKEGQVFSYDVSEEKVRMIRENADRCGFSQIRAGVRDARVFCPESGKTADVLIADLPCSGLGIIGRKNDIRYKMTQEKMKELAALQREILSAVWNYVKPGGILLYSTCTVDPAENEENRQFILDHFPFHPVDLTGRFSKEAPVNPQAAAAGSVQLLPGASGCDGFYFAVLQREKNS